jgi:hypothetical protein
MDVHVPRAVTTALRLRGIDVLTAQEDGSAELDDGPLLKRATELSHIWSRKTSIYCAKEPVFSASMTNSPALFMHISFG